MDLQFTTSIRKEQVGKRVFQKVSHPQKIGGVPPPIRPESGLKPHFCMRSPTIIQIEIALYLNYNTLLGFIEAFIEEVGKTWISGSPTAR